MLLKQTGAKLPNNNHSTVRLMFQPRTNTARKSLRFESLEDRSMMAAGVLDPTFGVGGKVITDLGGFEADVANCVAVQSDGKIVVAGFASIDSVSDFALARYNADGTLDASFDGDGMVITNFGGDYDVVQGIVLQSDGKIVVAGFTTTGTESDFALARYNVDGMLDASFDGDGKVTTDFGGRGFQGDRGRSVALQRDGKIVVAGVTDVSDGDDFSYGLAMARYNADGTLDASFDGDGKLAPFDGAGDHEALSVVVQSDDKIVVAGLRDDNHVLRRYNANGTLDASFDGDGKVTTDIGDSGFGNLASVALQSNGKIIFAGSSFNGSTYDFALARYNADGTLDGSFDGGKVTTDFQFSIDRSHSVVVQDDGRIVVAGSTRVGFEFESNDFALARYEGDPVVTGDTNNDGKIDLNDLNNVRNNFGLHGQDLAGDTDGDGEVDVDDLNNVRNNFGRHIGGPTAESARPSLSAGVGNKVAHDAAFDAHGRAFADRLYSQAADVPAKSDASREGQDTQRLATDHVFGAWFSAGETAAPKRHRRATVMN